MLKADRDAGSNSQAHRVIARLTVKGTVKAGGDSAQEAVPAPARQIDQTNKKSWACKLDNATPFSVIWSLAFLQLRQRRRITSSCPAIVIRS
jgi:hypothetical protein